MKYIPGKHQRLAKQHIIKNKRCAIFMRPGRGKTSSVLSAFNDLDLVEDVFPVLVISLFNVAQNVWSDETALWDEFRHLKVSVVLGTPSERRLALKVKAHFYTINFENVPWLIEELKEEWIFKAIVVDESSKLRGFRLRQGTKRSKLLSHVAYRVARFVELTGSPSPKGVESLWGQMWFLDKGERLGRTFTSFRERWFTQSFDGYSIEPLPQAQSEVQDKIKDICFSPDDEDFKVDEPLFTPIKAYMPDRAKRLYKKMEKEFFLSINDKEVEAFNAAVKSQKLLQIANGAVYTDDTGAFENIHNAKIDALENIIEELNGAPALVAYHFKSDLARLKKAFPKGRVMDKNPQTIRDWNKGKIDLMFIHPASAGHGINLQHGGNTLIFFGLTWDLELFEQVIERIGPARQKQSGYNRPVFIYLILAENTIDWDVYERLQSKKSIQEILMQAMAKHHA